MNVRRALLFMPGDDRRKIEKGAGSDADAIIMDLEDGVALNNKPAARVTIAAALAEVDFGRTERLVRINTPGTEWAEEDLAAIAPAGPDGLVLPKVHAAWQVQEVAARLDAVERAHGWTVGSTHLLAIIETARGVVNLREIAESDPRLEALIFGAEDLAGDLGITRTPEGQEMIYAREAVVIHARAYGLEAIDAVWINLNDQDGLAAQAHEAQRLGYTGKLAIHPRQVEVIQRVFTPDMEEIAEARRLIKAHDEQQAAGTGVFVLDGRMVDMPMIRQAQAVLARARAAGINVEGVE